MACPSTRRCSETSKRWTVARGDMVAARRWADEAVTNTAGYHRSTAMLGRARLAIAQGDSEEGARDARDALACAADVGAYLPIPDILECLAGLAGDAGSHREAARLFGAAHAIQERRGAIRYLVGGAGYYHAAVAALRHALARTTLNQHGLRAPPCRSRRRSLMRSAVAVNANARQPAGVRSLPPSVTWCGWSVRDWATRTLPPGFSSHRGRCNPTSRTSSPNSA